jgi:hypothetical protein
MNEVIEAYVITVWPEKMLLGLKNGNNPISILTRNQEMSSIQVMYLNIPYAIEFMHGRPHALGKDSRVEYTP